MTVGEIEPEHHAAFLAMNAEFVHWLAPMDAAELQRVLAIASYKRQTGNAKGVLIGYAHDADYPDHKNMDWLAARISNFFYIDRVIIAANAQGQGLGRVLYDDVERFARARGHHWIACEVNTLPNNPGSHKFHIQAGFEALGEQDYPDYGKALRYYAKRL